MSAPEVAEKARAAGYEGTTANQVHQYRYYYAKKTAKSADGKARKSDRPAELAPDRKRRKRPEGSVSALVREYPYDAPPAEVLRAIKKLGTKQARAATLKDVYTTRSRDKRGGDLDLYPKSASAKQMALPEHRAEVVPGRAAKPAPTGSSMVPVLRWTETEKQFARIAVSIGVQQAAAILQHVQTHMVKSLDSLFGKE